MSIQPITRVNKQGFLPPRVVSPKDIETINFTLGLMSIIAETQQERHQEICFYAVYEKEIKHQSNKNIKKLGSILFNLTDKIGRSLLRFCIDREEATYVQWICCDNELIKILSLNREDEILHAAVETNNIKLFETVYNGGSSGFNINAKDEKEGNTCLYKAIELITTNQQMTELLLQNGATLNLENKAGFCPLAYCVKVGNLEALKIIVQERGKTSEMHWKTRVEGIGNLLHIAIHFNQLKMLQYLLTHCKKEIEQHGLLNEENKDGLQPIHFAAARGDVLVIKLLVEAGTYVEEPNRKDGMTPLHFAVKNNHIDTAHFLIYEEASIESALAHCEKDSTIAVCLKNWQAMNNQVEGHLPNFFHKPPRTIVFQGGGPKGIAYIGALEVLDEKNLRKDVRRYAGTSAGAIIAVLLALDLSTKRIKEILQKTALEEFLDYAEGLDGLFDIKFIKEMLESKEGFIAKLNEAVKSSVKKEVQAQFEKAANYLWQSLCSIKNLSKELWGNDKLYGGFQAIFRAACEPQKKIEELVFNPLKELIREKASMKGICKGETFRKWIEEKIKEKTGIDHCTFQEWRDLCNTKGFKHLYVFGTNLNDSKIVRFSSEELGSYGHAIVSDVIRISMSIPFVFLPHTLHEKRDGQRTAVGNAEWVDGGLLCNFPLGEFDWRRYTHPGDQQHTGQFTTNRTTLGFSLYTTDVIEGNPNREIKNLKDLLLKMVEVFANAESLISDRKYKDGQRIIKISNEGVSLLDFDLPPKTQKKLQNSGRDATVAFMEKSEQAPGLPPPKLFPAITNPAAERGKKTQPDNNISPISYNPPETELAKFTLFIFGKAEVTDSIFERPEVNNFYASFYVLIKRILKYENLPNENSKTSQAVMLSLADRNIDPLGIERAIEEGLKLENLPPAELKTWEAISRVVDQLWKQQAIFLKEQSDQIELVKSLLVLNTVRGALTEKWSQKEKKMLQVEKKQTERLRTMLQEHENIVQELSNTSQELKRQFQEHENMIQDHKNVIQKQEEKIKQLEQILAEQPK